MITPSDAQAEAIRAIVRWYRTPGQQEFYLAGYAGTGKSTVAKLAIDELRDKCGVDRVRVGAFTGKAAHVLRQKGNHDAMTVHSMIYILDEDEEGGDPKFQLAIDGPASNADLIVLDEVSMISEEMADDVRFFGKKILVMGDPGQLPPVNGQGAFTNRTPDYFLTEVHRQAAESPILRLATWARLGKRIPIADYGDGVRVVELTKATQPQIYRGDTQVICGVHRVRWVYSQRIRKLRGFGGALPNVGERVICGRNNHEIGLFNGGMGTCISEPEMIDDNGMFVMSVQMDDRERPVTDMLVHRYLFDQHFSGPSKPPKLRKGQEVFDWGDVLTCHKLQGSEVPHATIIDDSAAFREDRHKWLYTALTRSSDGMLLMKRAA